MDLLTLWGWIHVHHLSSLYQKLGSAELWKLDPLSGPSHLRWFLVSLVWCPAPLAIEPALGQEQSGRPHGGGGWDADGGQAQSEIYLVAWQSWWAAT